MINYVWTKKVIDDKLNQQKRAARGMCGVCKNREKKYICICVVLKYSMQCARLWRAKWALFINSFVGPWQCTGILLVHNKV